MKAYYATNKILIETTQEELEFLKAGLHLESEFAEQMEIKDSGNEEKTKFWSELKVKCKSLKEDLHNILNSMPF